MEKNEIKNLYPVLDALTKEPEHPIATIVSSLKYVNNKVLAEEAKKLLIAINAYKEPVLPSFNVTKEDADSAFEKLDEHYGFVVWTNQLAGSDEDCVRRILEEPEYYMDMSEDQIRDISVTANAEDREMLRNEFDTMDIGGILGVGTIERWDGKKSVYFTHPSGHGIFQAFTDDQNTLYIKDGLLQAENVHHDGTDRWTFYAFDKDFDFDEEEGMTRAQLQKISKNIVPILNRHFGWTQNIQHNLIYQTCQDLRKTLPANIKVSVGICGIAIESAEIIIAINTDGSIYKNHEKSKVSDIIKELKKTDKNMADAVKKTVDIFKKNKEGMEVA